MAQDQPPAKHRGHGAQTADNKTPQKAPDSNAAKAADSKPAESKPADARPKDPLENMKFRNLGPAVGGGRITAVAGIPGKPNIYYAGAGGGGVFLTQDGGLSWKPIFKRRAQPPSGPLPWRPLIPIWCGWVLANPTSAMT